MQHTRNQRLQFEPVSHTYTLDGQHSLTSVTTMIENYFPVFNPDAAILKLKRKGTHPLAHHSPADIKKIWQEKTKTGQEAGTRLHEAIEAHLKGETVAGHDDVLQFVDRIQARELGTLVTTEWAIFDEEWGIAGTLDALFRQQNHYRLADWKRSKVKTKNPWERAKTPIGHLEACNFEKYSLQLALYRLILERRYQVDLGQHTPTIVQLHPDEQFRVLPAADRRQEARAIIADFCRRPREA